MRMRQRRRRDDQHPCTATDVGFDLSGARFQVLRHDTDVFAGLSEKLAVTGTKYSASRRSFSGRKYAPDAYIQVQTWLQTRLRLQQLGVS